MKNIVLLSLFSFLLLSGCSGSFSGEKRGFVYRVNGNEFVCLHEPMKTEVTIDKAVLGMAKVAEEPQKDPVSSADKFPSAKELVTYCQQLLNNTAIHWDDS